MQPVDTRKELAKLRILASKLATRATTVSDAEMCDLARKIVESSATVLNEVERETGPLPILSEQGAGLSVPLHLLDTPANRRLLQALEEAHAAALAVDYERGYGDDGPAQDLEDWFCETREEIFGPVGLRE